jgi:hypothetical protein
VWLRASYKALTWDVIALEKGLFLDAIGTWFICNDFKQKQKNLQYKQVNELFINQFVISSI